MSGFINRRRDVSRGKPYIIHLSCNDKFRSRADLLHRLIAQLSLQDFRIEKVDIWEKPVRANITFVETAEGESDTPRIAYFFKRRRTQGESRFKLSLSVNKLDRLGRRFQIDYNFSNLLRPGDDFEESGLDEDIHLMMEKAFAGNRNFIVSRKI